MSAKSVSPAHVKAELDRVLGSEEFGNAERMKSLLRYLVTETLAGRSDRLKGYNIGLDVFERDETFDPQTNPIVRVEAGRLRRLLRNYYLSQGSKDPVRIRVPKGGYVPVFECVLDEEQSRREAQGRPASQDPTLAFPGGPAIAVLPFDNMSGDPERSYIGNGIAEEIITQLTRFSTLFVLARNTTFQYLNKAVDVRSIAAELEANYVLEGSVRTSRNTVRITAQLIDAVTGVHVWAEKYDRDKSVATILEIEDDIAGRVAATIAEPHGVIARFDRARAKRRQTPSLASYDFLLRWFEYTWRYDPQMHARLAKDVDDLIERYPDDSMMWSARAELTIDESAWGFNPRDDPSPAEDRALRYCERAIELDPTNAKAYQSLMVTRYVRDELDHAFEAGRRALALNPNDADTVLEYGMFRCMAGDWEEGMAFAEKALILNPQHTGLTYVPFCLDRYRRGEDEAALAFAEQIAVSRLYWTPALRAMVCGQLGSMDKARVAIDTLLELFPNFESVAGDEIRRWLKEESLVERCLDGLAKAGLSIQQSA